MKDALRVGPSSNRQAAGLRAKRMGDWFERSFEHHCNFHSIIIKKIHSGMRTLSHNRIQRIRQPFDYICGFNGVIAVFDVKTVEGPTFAKSAIDANQARSLHDFEGHTLSSGYIVAFRSRNTVAFFPSVLLMRTLERTERCSLSPEDGLILGHLDNYDPRVLFLEE